VFARGAREREALHPIGNSRAGLLDADEVA
jgi:hypothetical protein